MRKTFLTWLLLFMTIAFIAAFFVSYNIQTRQAYTNAEKLIYLKIDDVIKQIAINNRNLREIRRETDANALAKVHAFAHMLKMNPSLVADYEELEKIRLLLAVDELHIIDDQGILFSGTVKEYYNYDMYSDPQSAAFMPGIKNKLFELAQDPQPKGINKEMFQYVGVSRKDAPGVVQIGYRPDKLARAMEVANIKNLAPGFRVGNFGSVLIALKSGEIISIADDKYLGKTVYEYGFNKNQLSGKSGSFVAQTPKGEMLVSYKTNGDYLIIGQLPTDEMYLSRNNTTTTLVLFNVLLFALIFFLVAKLVQTVVIDGIFKVNDSLQEITHGNLEERVEVTTNEEFKALSTGINSMVDALKEAIKEAAARIDAELAFAKAIQLSSLPSHFPAFPDRSEFDIFAFMNPAKEVGGDFYDFFLIGEDKLAVIIADVSGKGIAAALFMMRSKTLIKNLALSGIDVAEVFEKANDSLCEDNDAGMFVTAFMGILDLRSGRFTYVNAGHNPPLVKRVGQVFAWLPVNRSFVLAAMDSMKYSVQEIIFTPGDKLFLYTDGVTEATNKELALFSDGRLLGDLNQNAADDSLSPMDIIQLVKQSVDRFADGTEQADDITMLCLQYLG